MTVTRSALPPGAWGAGPGRLRVEGPLKLTGAARYAADYRPNGILHAVLVGAPVAAGRLRGLDAAAARILMRAPVEGPGLWALESAMNELADAAGLDPLDVRLANFAEVSPADGRPWSANGLREAYEEGARRYGWRSRHQRPRRDGPWVIGHGMATCTMGSFRFSGAGRVRLRRDGAVVEANVHDIGTGVQTVLSQIAAEELGIPPDRVETRWGDTDLPRTGPTYGSSTTMGTGSAVAAAARDVTKQLAELGQGGRDPFEAFDRAGLDELVGEGTFALPGGAQFNQAGAGTQYAIRTWGVIFVEVGVDPDFGLLRLRRAVSVYSAGRIVNSVTARAQPLTEGPAGPCRRTGRWGAMPLSSWHGQVLRHPSGQPAAARDHPDRRDRGQAA